MASLLSLIQRRQGGQEGVAARPGKASSMHRATAAPRRVDSNQSGLHPRLAERVRRHLLHPYRRPVAEHNRRAVEQAAERLAEHDGPLLLDSFCGVGASTALLACRHPEALVVGLDKSARRLARHGHHLPASAGGRLPDNCLLVRAEVDDFWRLAAEAGWRPQAHYLLYPNPWPKAAHLQRRVHGSPVFPHLLELGGRIELRSNWRLYLEECAAALALAEWTARLRPLPPAPPWTPFERKYAAAGQSLWQLVALPGPESHSAPAP